MLCRRCGSALTYISGCIVRSVRPAAFRRQASDNHSGAMLEIGQPQLQISSAFDSGNIEIAGDAASLDPSDVQLRIRPDPYCKSDEQAHYQWFHFQVTGVINQPLTIHIMNAGQSSYPSAWNGYQACASYDLQHWFRVDTAYDSDKGVLTIRHTPKHKCIRFAYFAPYSWERHAELIMRLQHRDRVELNLLGRTLDGRDLHMLQIGQPAADKANIWVIARQHPGESMAEWFAEGLLERLTGPKAAGDDEVSALLKSAVLYVVPNMCLDGAVRGHLRTNACGANLNREWAHPTAERSPEVLAVSQAMKKTGLDMLLDVHGDEEIPANFIGSMFGVPAWGPRLERLQSAYTETMLSLTPDFQTKLGYPLPPAGGGNLATASKANAQKYNTLSLVLEQPFKDCIDNPNHETGWSPERAMKFGADHVTCFARIAPILLKERSTKDL